MQSIFVYYDTLKECTLKACELVPVPYHQSNLLTKLIWNLRVTKKQYLNRWVAAKEINENYEKMRQLILIEEFKRQIHFDKIKSLG